MKTESKRRMGSEIVTSEWWETATRETIKRESRSRNGEKYSREKS